MSDLTVLRQRLTEAEDALHQLSIGKRTVTLGKDGTTVSYTPASVPALKDYIRTLKGQIERAEGRPVRKSLVVEF